MMKNDDPGFISPNEQSNKVQSVRNKVYSDFRVDLGTKIVDFIKPTNKLYYLRIGL